MIPLLDEKQKDDAHKDALDRFQQAQTFWSMIHTDSKYDIQFRWGEQWDNIDKQNRDIDNRAYNTVNYIGPFVDRYVNDIKQNSPTINLSPNQNIQSKDGVMLLGDYMRGLLRRTDFNIATARVAENQCAGGEAWYRVFAVPRKNSDTVDLKIESIPYTSSVFIDPMFSDLNAADMQWGFVVENMPRKEYEKEFGDVASVDFAGPGVISDWFKDDVVRIADYYYLDEYNRTLITFQDNSQLYDEDHDNMSDADILKLAKMPRLSEKTETKSFVRHLKIDGNKVLKDTAIEISQIPLIFVPGREEIRGDRRYFSGMTRLLKDLQNNINYLMSIQIEMISSAPKAPYIIGATALRGFEAWWDNINTANFPYVPFQDRDASGDPVPPPSRQSFAVEIQHLAATIDSMFQKMKEITGIYDVGAPTPLASESPKAIMLRTEQANTAIVAYAFNLYRGIEQVGKIIVEWLPSIKVSPSSELLISERSETRQMQVPEVVFDYDPMNPPFTLEAGKSWANSQQELADQLLAWAQAFPTKADSIADIALEALNIPGGKEAVDRIRRTIDPSVLSDAPVPPQVQALMKQQDDLINSLQGENAILQQAVNSKSAEVAASVEREIIKSRAQLAQEEIKAQTSIEVAHIGASKEFIKKDLNPPPAQPILTGDATIPLAPQLVSGLPLTDSVMQGQPPIPSPAIPPKSDVAGQAMNMPPMPVDQGLQMPGAQPPPSAPSQPMGPA